MRGRVTTDTNDPRIRRGGGPDNNPVPQNEAYLVLSDEEIALGSVRPYRETYMHVRGQGNDCNGTTTMGPKIAATYARNPNFYTFTYCAKCRRHRPVAEFDWQGTNEAVGS